MMSFTIYWLGKDFGVLVKFEGKCRHRELQPICR